MRLPRLRPLLLLLCLSSCHSWVRQDFAPGAAPARAVGDHVRATRADGSRVELASASLAGDTLRGERWEIGRDGRRVAMAVPLDSVRRLEARRVSAGRTGALVGGVVLVVGLFLALAASAVATGSLMDGPQSRMESSTCQMLRGWG
jgi:hypothetical protein